MAHAERDAEGESSSPPLVDGRPLREWVEDAVGRLVSATGARTIVLFGSVARGDATATSDIDLLVLVNDDADVRRASIAALRAVADLPPEVDVVVVTRRSLESGRNRPGTVIRPALREGEVVYERAA